MKKSLVALVTSSFALAFIAGTPEESQAVSKTISVPCLAYVDWGSNTTKITNDLCYQVQAKVAYSVISSSGTWTSHVMCGSKTMSVSTAYIQGSNIAVNGHSGDFWPSMTSGFSTINF